MCDFFSFIRKKEEQVLFLFFSLVSLLEAVAASTMLTVAGVANVNLIELAMHAVRIELALRYAARNAAVDIVTHTVFLLAFIIPLP